MRSEANKIELPDSNVWDYLKNLSNKMDKGSQLQGYVRDVISDPQGVYLFSEASLRIYQYRVRAENGIVYMDATSGKVKKNKVSCWIIFLQHC